MCPLDMDLGVEYQVLCPEAWTVGIETLQRQCLSKSPAPSIKMLLYQPQHTAQTPGVTGRLLRAGTVPEEGPEWEHHGPGASL